jgi:hypothetical protein
MKSTSSSDTDRLYVSYIQTVWRTSPEGRCRKDQAGPALRSDRQHLVTTARVLIAERSYASVGTEEIVQAAGATRSALYY